MTPTARSLVVLLLTICLTSITSAQTSWWRTYGGIGLEGGYSVQQTTDGGYIVAGYSWPPDSNDINLYIIKTTATGETLWTRAYGGPFYDWGRSVQQTTDGGYIVVGYYSTNHPVVDYVYMVKINAQGDTLWTRTHHLTDGAVGYSVQQTADGGYVIAGTATTQGASDINVCLIKTSETGDTIWTRTYGGSRVDGGYSVSQTTDGGYIITGSTRSFGAGSDDVFLIKTNACGDTSWTRTYGGVNEDQGYSVQQTSDGGYIVVGWTYSFGAGTPNGENVYLIKTDSCGDTVWTRTYGGDANDKGFSVDQTSDGSYVIACCTYSFGA